MSGKGFWAQAPRPGAGQRLSLVPRGGEGRGLAANRRLAMTDSRLGAAR
ncbi:MAG: hypothetical protein KAX64_07920 [Chromatiaceae bacterium]|nr:hypothetical protein [Chromatiaceae bacterium]